MSYKIDNGGERRREPVFHCKHTRRQKRFSIRRFFAHIDAAPARHSSVIWTALCDFTGFKLGFEELEDADRTLVAETAFRVVELGKGRGGIQLDKGTAYVPAVLCHQHPSHFCDKALYLKPYILCHSSVCFKTC